MGAKQLKIEWYLRTLYSHFSIVPEGQHTLDVFHNVVDGKLTSSVDDKTFIYCSTIGPAASIEDGKAAVHSSPTTRFYDASRSSFTRSKGRSRHARPLGQEEGPRQGSGRSRGSLSQAGFSGQP